MNYLIACGGTGAHVALAMCRLHFLGYPLGFFRDATNDELVPFPDLFLVDQDSGDGIRERTAWQAVRALLEQHPGRYHWKKATGRENKPAIESVSPLPLGELREWYNPPYNTLKSRFNSSSMLELLASEKQQRIDFSLGMMGSPAIGSLLFKLKEYDLKLNRINHDHSYSTMRDKRGRVVITGSGVGGTGASVAPTLASQFAEDGASVMAVMIQQWFKFRLSSLSEDVYEKSKLRNDVMKENAAAGLASYGQDLAKNAAAVLVGVPEVALDERNFTSDNQQPIHDSHVHVVAALSAMQHFTEREGFSKGIYGMSASNQTQLTGDIALGNDSLQDLIDRASVFAYVLNVFANVLENFSAGNGKLEPELYSEVSKLTEVPEKVGKYLKQQYLKHYDECLNWLVSLGVENSKPDKEQLTERFTLQNCSKERFSEHPLPSVANEDLNPERIASQLFDWTAEWVREEWREEFVRHRSPAASSSGKGYWPDQKDTGEAPQWKSAGKLAKVSEDKVQGALKNLYDPEIVSQNGWPHPVAAVEQFRFHIQGGTGSAARQLEMLLVGLVTQTLQLEQVKEAGYGSDLSIEHLVKNLRHGRFGGVAEYRVVRKHDRKLFGFNTPHTLLCPVPGLSDRDWQQLWCDLGAKDDQGWKTSQEWGLRGERARGCIRSWIERLSFPELPPWAEAIRSDERKQPFGVLGELPVYRERDNLVFVPLPSLNSSQQASPNSPKREGGTQGLAEVSREVFLEEVPQFKEYEGYCLCEGFRIPDRETPITVIWKEHLEALQRSGHIFYYAADANRDHLEIAWDLERKVLFDDTRVIDEAAIRVPTCIALEQRHVPTRSSRDRVMTLYPDLPIQPQYIALVRTKDDKDLVELLINGVTDKDRLRTGPKPEVRANTVTWTLKLKGRPDVLRITIQVNSLKEGKRDRAHWMLWPNFRSKRESEPWRAYYVYANCTRPSLEVHPLFVSQDRLTKKEAAVPTVGSPARAIRFDTKERQHVGGPPVALCSYDNAMRCDVGIYLVRLKAYERSESSCKLAVDFGTSHSLAATEGPDKRGRPINLDPDFPSDGRSDSLTLHISENWPDAPNPELWRPTYLEERLPGTEALIPSELMSVKSLVQLTDSDIRKWEPLRDCVIPAMDMQRDDLPDHILSGFKWEVSQLRFQGSEQCLRETYLCMALEVFMADWVHEHAKLPQSVDVTFTFPLRSSKSEVEEFQKSLKKVFRRSSKSLGCDFSPVEDEGLYSESHAAKGGKKQSEEVVLVGDLGGGTLDLLISTTAIGEYQHCREVADSAKLGGNLLIELLAKKATLYLPREGGWDLADKNACAAQLRAWMRACGSPRLFGPKAYDLQHKGLKLKGFENPAQGNRARKLINRYFGLITDYMARSLTAFVGQELWPRLGQANRGRLKIVVQLRGNGWRLWYGDDDYSKIEQRMTELVRERSKSLWEFMEDKDVLDVLGDKHWSLRPKVSQVSKAKIDPICSVVGKNLGLKRAKDNSTRYALSDLELIFADSRVRKVDWFENLPFQDARDANPQIRSFQPAIVADDIEIKELEDHWMNEIHDNIQGPKRVLDGSELDAPIAAEIWEHVLLSEQLTTGS